MIASRTLRALATLSAVAIMAAPTIAPADAAPFEVAESGGGCYDPFLPASVSHACTHDEDAGTDGSFHLSVQSRSRLQGRAHSVGTVSNYAWLQTTRQLAGVQAVEATATVSIPEAAIDSSTGALSFGVQPMAYLSGALWLSARCDGYCSSRDSWSSIEEPGVMTLRSVHWSCDDPLTAVGIDMMLEAWATHGSSQGSVSAAMKGTVTSLEVAAVPVPEDACG